MSGIYLKGVFDGREDIYNAVNDQHITNILKKSVPVRTASLYW